jgi:ketosteroid isomerase-like protein
VPRNVEIVRQSFAAFNARAVEDLVRLSDPDCEWIPFRAQLEGTTYHGHAGVRQFIRDMDEDWAAFRIDPAEFHERDERVAAIGKVTALGRSSGADISWVGGFLFELRAGKITKLVSHSDPAVALQAVGVTVPSRSGRTLDS